MRPVTSQVAAEIGYDPAGRDRSRALHPAGRRTPSRRRPPLGTPHQQHRPNQRRHRRLSGRDLPRQPPQHRYRTRRPYHPRPAPVAHLRSLGGDAGGASHYIPAYPGISRYISGSFFLFAGTKAAAPRISRHISDPFFCSRATGSWPTCASSSACSPTTWSHIRLAMSRIVSYAKTFEQPGV